MDNNIICAGALFYSINTKRFLFLQRTAGKTKGLWGLAGGKARFEESAFEGLKREVKEELGHTPNFKKVVPLELFTSNDQKFFFNTELSICNRNRFSIIWFNISIINIFS